MTRSLTQALVLGFVCTVLPGLSPAADANLESPFFVLPAGSVVKLNQELAVRGADTRAYVQFGQPSSFARYEAWYPFCYFELKGKPPEAQRIIEPAGFSVSRVVRYWRQADLGGGFEPLAANGWMLAQGGGGPQDVVYFTEIYLDGPDGSDVWRMVCRERFVLGSFSAEHLSVSKIRKVLGEIATIELP